MVVEIVFCPLLGRWVLHPVAPSVFSCGTSSLHQTSWVGTTFGLPSNFAVPVQFVEALIECFSFIRVVSLVASFISLPVTTKRVPRIELLSPKGTELRSKRRFNAKIKLKLSERLLL